MPAALISASTLGSIRPGGGWQCLDSDILGQALTLRSIEHGEPFEERDRLGLLAGLADALLLVVGNEAVGIDDSGAAFALHHIAAERKGLAKRQPALAGKPCWINAPQRISS